MSRASESLLSRIREAEGYRDKPYRCPAGHLTIGYGTNIERIDREEAEWLMTRRLNKAIGEVHSRWPFVQHMTERRRDAVYDMAYNMGVPTLAGFRKMWAALQAGAYNTAADEAKDSRWYNQVGRRAEQIVTMIRGG